MIKWFLLNRINLQSNTMTIGGQIQHSISVASYSAVSVLPISDLADPGAKVALHSLILKRFPPLCSVLVNQLLNVPELCAEISL